MAKHRGEPSFYCTQCTKSFMRLGDLKEHEETHSKHIYNCPEKGCTFMAKLKYYIHIHVCTTHTDENDLPYPCEKEGCDCSFKYYEQRK